MTKRRRVSNEQQSEPWHFSHVQEFPIASTFTQVQESQTPEAPYEFTDIQMYDPSVLQSTQSQLMPFIRGVHYTISPYLSANFWNRLFTAITPTAIGANDFVDAGFSTWAALFDDAGEHNLNEVDQIGHAEFGGVVYQNNLTASPNTCYAQTRTMTRYGVDVTFQHGWLPSPVLSLAFLLTLSQAVDATTFLAETFTVQGFLEVEWRVTSPERLKQQALARLFEKGA
jgi:hypothetical protein